MESQLATIIELLQTIIALLVVLVAWPAFIIKK